MDMSESMTNLSLVELVSKDGECFMVSLEAAKLSTFIAGLLPSNIVDGESNEIPLPIVESCTLSLVITFCNQFNKEPMTEIEKPLKNTDLYELVQHFYAKFIVEMDNENLYKLIMAADYLGIQPLLNLCSAKIASLIQDKTVEEIRINLGIVNDFAPEEEAKVRSDNKWVEDL